MNKNSHTITNTKGDDKASQTVKHISTAEFWQQRYEAGYTGWDIGQVSPPIRAYIDYLMVCGVDKSSRILIAGAGNAHEAVYLHEQGFGQVMVLDFAAAPLHNLAKACPDFPAQHLLQADFFELSKTDWQFDFIIEQTFFCAIDPARRADYAKQMASLLKPTGELFGVLFDRQFDSSPPFGGSLTEYQNLFAQYFDKVSLEPCYNSIAPRQGTELFVRLGWV